MSETKNRSSLRRHATAALAIAAIALCTIPAHHSWASKSTLLEEKTEAPKAQKSPNDRIMDRFNTQSRINTRWEHSKHGTRDEDW